MLDPVAAERGERELDRLIEGRSKGRAEANREAERIKAEDRRKLEEMHQENRALWCDHLRRLSANYVSLARDARRRARRLEESGQQ